MVRFYSIFLVTLSFGAAEASSCSEDGLAALGKLNSTTRQQSAGKILVRVQRGGLDESLKTTVAIEPTIDALADAFSKSLGFRVDANKIRVEPYSANASGKPFFDDRIGWHTYVVLIDGSAVGFANGMISPPAILSK